MESRFEEDEFHVLQGQRSGKGPADQLVCFPASQVSHRKEPDCVLVDILTFLVECGFLGTSRGAEGRWWGEAAVRVATLCRSLCSPAQRASSHLTAVLLMSCRAREAVKLMKLLICSNNLCGFAIYTHQNEISFDR